MENSHRKISLLSLIALRNYIPRVICANDASNQSRAIYSREICRVLETINPIGGVSLKKLLAFNNRQWDHELIRQNAAYEKTKTDFGKFLCCISPLRLHQIRGDVKNTYSLKKLWSRVTDNCMNTSPRLVRKYQRVQRIYVRRHHLFQNATFSDKIVHLAFECILIMW